MRVLLISYFFPPYNTIGAVRVGKTARYLLEQGFDVRVLTAVEQSWKGALPLNLRLEIPEDKVVYAGSPRLSRFVGSLIRRLTGGESGNGHFAWFPFAFLEAMRLINTWTPDVLFASGLPVTSFWAAFLISKRTKIPWVAELRDLWADNPTYAPWRRFVEGAVERLVLPSASGMVTVSEPLADTLRRKYGKKVVVVYNGFDDGVMLETQNADTSGRLKILYTGTLYKKWRDPTPLFLALKELGPLAENVQVAFYGPGLEFAVEAAEQAGVRSCVDVYPPVSYEESLRLQAQSDVLLLLQWADPREKGIYTGKLFEYIGSRRPILSVGPTDNEPSELIVSHGFGVALNRPHEIAAQIKRWLAQKRQTGIPALPKENTLPFSRARQLEKVGLFLQETADSACRPSSR